MAEPNTLEREWLDFAGHFPGLPENDEARRMWYSGAIAVVAMTYRVAHESPASVTPLFQRLRKEIDDHFAQARRDNERNGSRLIVPH